MTVVEDLKDQIDLLDMVGKYVTLQKSGKNFKSNCPFHTEKTPSFFVFPDRQTWRCFGACATGGDIFSFIQKIDNISFSEALRKLADENGISLSRDSTRNNSDKEKKAKIQDILLITEEYFHRILVFSPAGEEARNYFASRGISTETIEEFKLGLAPNGWEVLKKHLLDLGKKEEDIHEAGLLIKREEEKSGSYDRFRNRIVFPIKNQNGDIVGFGARTLDGSQPKYLNSPQTILFDKSKVLYGLNKVVNALKPDMPIVLVEGYMDVLQAHQSGFKNVAAIMGTALTQEQLKIAQRYTHSFILALDSDAAGVEATRRSLEGAWDLFQREIIRVRGLSLPVTVKRKMPDLKVMQLNSGKDPDEVIRKEPHDWEIAVKEAKPILEYLISWEVSQERELTSELKLDIVQKIFPLIQSLDNPFERESSFSKLAMALGESEKTLELAVGSPISKKSAKMNSSVIKDDNAFKLKNVEDAVERQILGIVLVYGEKAWQTWKKLGIPDLPVECFTNPEHAELWRVLHAGEAVEEAEVIVSGLAETLRSNLVAPLSDRNLGKALGDLVKRLLERHIKSQEEEASLALASSVNEKSDEERTQDPLLSKQFIDRMEELRKIERSRWGRSPRR
jgi:DNA primase